MGRTEPLPQPQGMRSPLLPRQQIVSSILAEPPYYNLAASAARTRHSLTALAARTCRFPPQRYGLAGLLCPHELSRRLSGSCMRVGTTRGIIPFTHRSRPGVFGYSTFGAVTCGLLGVLFHPGYRLRSQQLPAKKRTSRPAPPEASQRAWKSPFLGSWKSVSAGGSTLRIGRADWERGVRTENGKKTSRRHSFWRAQRRA